MVLNIRYPVKFFERFATFHNFFLTEVSFNILSLEKLKRLITRLKLLFKLSRLTFLFKLISNSPTCK